jgi:hypothetical protein
MVVHNRNSIYRLVIWYYGRLQHPITRTARDVAHNSLIAKAGAIGPPFNLTIRSLTAVLIARNSPKRSAVAELPPIYERPKVTTLTSEQATRRLEFERRRSRDKIRDRTGSAAMLR